MGVPEVEIRATKAEGEEAIDSTEEQPEVAEDLARARD